jgi:3-deoxy-7-phosphoheptulonate synthase
MILVLNDAHTREVQSAKATLESEGHKAYMLQTSRGQVCTVLDVREPELERLRSSAMEISLVDHSIPYILASRRIKDTKTVIDIRGDATIGGTELCVIAGPCSIESEGQIMETARAIRESGAAVLRGGAFKPRSSPYAFQGMGIEGLKLLRKAGDAFGLPIITEVMDHDDIPVISEYSDVLQIGARNCQNFSLLKKLGKTSKPVLLKRGMMVTIEEFLMSAEYILSGGNLNVILCERGIRTFETGTRNTLDISAVPVLKERTHLPVLVDPSHAAGDWRLIHPLSLAAIAAGADGLMIEVHPYPERALCDGNQSLRPDKFEALMGAIRTIAPMLGRSVASYGY